MKWIINDKEEHHIGDPTREDMIDYIAARQHGIPSTYVIERTPEHEKARFITFDSLDHRDALMDPLYRLPASDLKNLFNVEEAKLDSEARSKIKRLDQTDVDTWCQRSLWTTEQAVALSFAFNPQPDLSDWAERNRTFHTDAARIHVRVEQIKRALTARELQDPIRPSAFLSWAAERHFLNKDIFSFEIKNINLRDQLRAAQECLHETEAELAKLRHQLWVKESSSYKRLLAIFAAVCLGYPEEGVSNQKKTRKKRIMESIVQWSGLFGEKKSDSARTDLLRLLEAAKLGLPQESVALLIKHGLLGRVDGICQAQRMDSQVP